MSAQFDYVRDPARIYRESFATVLAETDVTGLGAAEAAVALRLVHASAMPEIAADLAFAPGAADQGRRALEGGAPVLADAEMVAAGVNRRRLPKANEIICTLNDPRVPALAEEQATTRSAAAVTLWPAHLAGAVVAIGNAPTALFRLLEGLAEGWPRPAVVLGFAVGFIGAAESKESLIENGLGVPFIALRGRLGGSAMAAAAVNALAQTPQTPGTEEAAP